MGGREKRRKKRKRGQQPRLSIYEVSQVVMQKGIKSKLELLSLANQQEKEGKTDLAKFIANHGCKAVEEALRVGWEIEEAPAKLKRNQKT